MIENYNITSSKSLLFILSWYWKSFLKTQPNKDVYCLDSWDNFKTKRKFEKRPVSSCILYLVYIMLIVCCVSGCLKYTANMLKVLPLVISYWQQLLGNICANEL